MMLPGWRRSQSGRTHVRPAAKWDRTKTGKADNTISLGAWPRDPWRALCCASKNPWLRAIAFGAPVLPLVKVTNAGAWLATPAMSALPVPRLNSA